MAPFLLPFLAIAPFFEKLKIKIKNADIYIS